MKLNTLMNALEYYLQSADCKANGDAIDTMAAIKHVAAVQERYDKESPWREDIYIVTAWALDNLLNTSTYDIYGKLARQSAPHKVSFNHYARNCRTFLGLDELTDDELRLGYDIISDLWSDNEYMGSHHIDGTFKHENDSIQQIINYKEWFDGLLGPAATEESIAQLYNDCISINIAGKEITLPFDAENYNNVEVVIQKAIENW
jgi:hypothetical protein